MTRYARRADKTQPEIVKALELAGWEVHYIEEPCDLLCIKHGVAKLLECKTPNRVGGKFKPRADQREQTEFCERNKVPYVTSAESALRALGEIE